jgi:hypothetical protein
VHLSRLIFLMGIGVASVCAGPITTYDIRFIADSGTPPVSGSFGYDGKSFTNFLVNWMGNVFDLTAGANAPNANFACAYGTEYYAFTGPETTFTWMTTGTCGGGGSETRTWSGMNSNSVFIFLGGGPGNITFNAFGPPGDLAPGHGTFTVTAVPEPASVTMLVLALSVITLLRLRGNKSNSPGKEGARLSK